MAAPPLVCTFMYISSLFGASFGTEYIDHISGLCVLSPGDWILSMDKTVAFHFQKDGNFVLKWRDSTSSAWNPKWATNTAKKATEPSLLFAGKLGSGEFYVYEKSTKTKYYESTPIVKSENRPFFLVVSNSRIGYVLSSTNEVIWSTTSLSSPYPTFAAPTAATLHPSQSPSYAPTAGTKIPSIATKMPSETPSNAPNTRRPTYMPSDTPSNAPHTRGPTYMPSDIPSNAPDADTHPPTMKELIVSETMDNMETTASRNEGKSQPDDHMAISVEIALVLIGVLTGLLVICFLCCRVFHWKRKTAYYKDFVYTDERRAKLNKSLMNNVNVSEEPDPIQIFAEQTRGGSISLCGGDSLEIVDDINTVHGNTTGEYEFNTHALQRVSSEGVQKDDEAQITQMVPDTVHVQMVVDNITNTKGFIE
eukprot:698012_1